jgi:hypothetical protein
MIGPLLAVSLRVLVASPAFLPPAPQAADDVQVNSPSTARQSDADIKVDPNDPLHLIAGAEDWRGGTTNCVYYASFDGGLTWIENFFPDPDGLGHAKSPGVAFGPNGEDVLRRRRVRPGLRPLDDLRRYVDRWRRDDPDLARDHGGDARVLRLQPAHRRRLER